MKYFVYILCATIALSFYSCGLLKNTTTKLLRTEIIEKPVYINTSVRDSIVIIIPPKILRDTVTLSTTWIDTVIIKENDYLVMEIRLDSVRKKVYAECRQANTRIEYRERVLEKGIPVETIRTITEVSEKDCDCPSLFWYTCKVIGITLVVFALLLLIGRLFKLFIL